MNKDCLEHSVLQHFYKIHDKKKLFFVIRNVYKDSLKGGRIIVKYMYYIIAPQIFILLLLNIN